MYSNNSNNNNNNNINALNYDFDLDEFLTNVVMLDNISFPSTSSTTSSSSTPSPSLDSGKTTVNTFQGPTFGNTTSMKQQQQQQQQQPLMSQRQQQTEQQQHSFFQQSKDVKNISNQPVYQQQQQQQQQVLAEQQLSQHVQKHPRLYDQQQQQQQSSDFNALPLSSSFTFPNTNILSDNQSGSNQLSLHQQIQQQYFQHQQAKQQQAVSNAQQMQNQTGVLMSESKFQHHHTSSTIASANATLGATTTATSTATNAPTLGAENNDNIKKTTMLTKKRNSEDFDVDDMDDDGDDMDSSDNKKSPWTLDEDLKLVQLFNEFGSSWSRISNVMQTRNKIDIKNRFRSIIRARNRIWTPEEDEKLLQLHEELGSNWQIIQSHFSNRTRHALRVRYKYLRDNKPSETTGGESSQHSPPELLVPGSPYQVLIYCRENVTYSPLLSTINKCAKQSPKPPLKNKLESPAPSTFVPKRSSSLAASTPKQTIQPVATPISSAIGRKQSSGMSSAASTPATIAVIPTHYNTNDEMRSSLPSNEAYIKYERDDSIFGTFDFPPIETGFEDASGFASYEESVLDSDYKL